MSVLDLGSAYGGKPVQTFKVHEHLRPKLCDLYENDCIFDKFQATWSGDDRLVTLCIGSAIYMEMFEALLSMVLILLGYYCSRVTL